MLALAVCPNDETILIFSRPVSGNQWKLATKLEGHDQLVTALDWYTDGKGESKLLSVSADRNAYVWTQKGGCACDVGLLARAGATTTSILM